MPKLTKQNVGGANYTMVGCTLTGVCPSAAADYIKEVTLSDGDVVSDGMMVACTFANGNTAGIAPASTTIYSSDQVNYYTDSGLTVPFTLAPSGCYTIEYTGTGNAYTYTSFPVIQVGAVSGPLCASNGIPSGGTAWSAGDTVVLLYTGGKFLAINVVTNTVAVNNMYSVSSNAVTEWVNPSNTEYHGQNTQVFKINDIMWNNYMIIFFVGYIGNVGSVAGYVKRSDLTFRKFDDTDLGTSKPTITLNTSTKELKITASSGGILLCALGAKHLRWE